MPTTKRPTDQPRLCLYCSWTHKDGKGKTHTMQSCFPHTSPINAAEMRQRKKGDKVKIDGMTYHVIECKYPRCL